MFNSVAYAQEVAEEVVVESVSPIQVFLQQNSMLIMTIIFVFIFYFVVMRPQKKKQKELEEQLSRLKSGDKVMLTSGIFATVDAVGENNTYYVQIGSGTVIRVVKSAIASKIDESTAEKK